MKKYLQIILITLTIFAVIFSLLFYTELISQSVSSQKPINKELVKFTAVRFLNKIDAINPFISRTALDQHHYPIIDIKLKRKNVDHLSEVVERAKENGYMSSDFGNNTYTKVKLFMDGNKYDAKLKLHGNTQQHYQNNKKSFRIKLSKEGKYYKNMRRFSLVLVEESSINTIFSYKLLQYFTGLKVNSFFVKVKINGIDQGLYLLEEKIQKELLERNGLSGVDILKPYDHWDNQFGGHWVPYSFEPSYTKHQNISKKDTGQLYRYSKLYNESLAYSDLSNLVELDKFAKHEALRVLFNNFHLATGDNQRLLYNTSSGKFSPYFRSEGVLKKLTIDKSNSDNTITFEQDLYGVHSVTKNSLLIRLIRNNDFRKNRNFYLSQLLKDREYILNLYQNLLNKHIEAIASDPTINSGSRLTKYYEREKYDNLVYNFNVIENYLNYSKALVEIKKINDYKHILKIIPDSNVPIKINNIEFTGKGSNHSVVIKRLGANLEKTILVKDLSDFFQNELYVLDLDDQLSTSINKYKYEIIDDSGQLDFTDLQISFNNVIIDKELKKKNIYYSFIDETRSFKDKSIENFIKHNSDINLEVDKDKKRITIKTGLYELHKNLILPFGYSLVIEKGTIINISSDKSILVYGSIHLNGVRNDPVIIKNLEKGKPFGVFAGIGNKSWDVNISNLDISGGSEAVLNGIHFSGALSLYSYKKAMIENSLIHHNVADDGLNIKNTDIFLENNNFISNSSDQVDLDFCKGYVLNNKFFFKQSSDNYQDINIFYDDNGDGLDLSGSVVVVKDNHYSNFLDKGISVGENTQAFITDNIFENNNISIAVKDQSDVYVSSNKYENNKIEIEIFQKKKVFDYPSVYNLNELHSNKKLKVMKGSYYYKSETPVKVNSLELSNLFFNLKNKEWVEYSHDSL
jgi:hypothetical protein